MKRIAILGSGGFAKEVYYLIQDINKPEQRYDVVGFIDANRAGELVIDQKSIPIFSESESFERFAGLELAIGIGDPKIIRKVTDKFHAFQFPNLIHPSATGYFETIKFESGNIITAGCRFTLDIRVGSFNIFNLNVTIGHDAVLGSCNVLNPGVNISGGVHIGNENLIGTNATILQNISMGSHSILGASALLTKSIENEVMAVGVPAKVVNRG